MSRTALDYGFSVLHLLGVSTPARLLFLYVCDAAHESSMETFPTKARTIAAKLGVSKRCIQASARALQNAGYLELIDASGLNVYRVNVPLAFTARDGRRPRHTVAATPDPWPGLDCSPAFPGSQVIPGMNQDHGGVKPSNSRDEPGSWGGGQVIPGMNQDHGGVNQLHGGGDPSSCPSIPFSTPPPVDPQDLAGVLRLAYRVREWSHDRHGHARVCLNSAKTPTEPPSGATLTLFRQALIRHPCSEEELELMARSIGSSDYFAKMRVVPLGWLCQTPSTRGNDHFANLLAHVRTAVKLPGSAGSKREKAPRRVVKAPGASAPGPGMPAARRGRSKPAPAPGPKAPVTADDPRQSSIFDLLRTNDIGRKEQ